MAGGVFCTLCVLEIFCRGRFYIGPGSLQWGKHPRAGENPPLRINFVFRAEPERHNACGGPPLQTTENDRPNRTAATARAFVGRDALIPPGPAAGRTFRFWNRRGAAGVNARPTGRGKPRGEPEKRGPALQQTSVGDDACIVPGALRRGEACGRIWNPPLRAEGKTCGQPQSQPHRAPCRGAHCAPGNPAVGQTPAGGINPAPTNKFCVSGQSGTAATTRTTVGRDALIPPGLAAAQTPRAG